MRQWRNWFLFGVVLCGGAAPAPGDEGKESLELLDPSAVGRGCGRGAVCVKGADTRGGDGWTLELRASLARPALAGNALFLFYDLEDASSAVDHEVTMLRQHAVAAGRAVAARVRISADDGFVAGHAYCVQVAQLVGGKEVVLAQGDFALK